MPTTEQWKKIDRVTADLDPGTAHAMRTLFVITEHENIPEANDLIIAALQEKSKVPASAITVLARYRLVGPDGTIAKPFTEAIQSAVKDRYLEIKGRPTPQLKMLLRSLFGWSWAPTFELNFRPVEERA